MTPALRPIAAMLLLAAGTLAHAAAGNPAFDTFSGFAPAVMPPDESGAGAGSVAAQYVSHGVPQDRSSMPAALEWVRAGGFSAGAGSARAGGGAIDNGPVALRTYAGYRHALGAFDVDATFNYTSYPGARRALTGAGYDYGELSAGLRYGGLSARYGTTLTRDAFGVPNARGSSYLDLGMRRDLGHAMSLMLHAGDGHVAGSGNGMFDWRDLKAGLNRRLEGGWLVALNYTRAYGAAGPDDRAAPTAARAQDRPAYLSAGRRALVLSAARSF